MTLEEKVAQLAAIASTQRFRIVAELSDGPVHVSELARRLGMSRALLYLHLQRLEEAGILTGTLGISEDGKALKIFELVPFSIVTTPESIKKAVELDNKSVNIEEGEK